MEYVTVSICLASESVTATVNLRTVFSAILFSSGVVDSSKVRVAPSATFVVTVYVVSSSPKVTTFPTFTTDSVVSVTSVVSSTSVISTVAGPVSTASSLSITSSVSTVSALSVASSVSTVSALSAVSTVSTASTLSVVSTLFASCAYAVCGMDVTTIVTANNIASVCLNFFLIDVFKPIFSFRLFRSF